MSSKTAELDDIARAAKTLLTVRAKLLDTVAVPSLVPEYVALLQLDEDKLRVIAKEGQSDG